MSTNRPGPGAWPRARRPASAPVLEALKDDHRRIRKAYARFRERDPGSDAEACRALVEPVLEALLAHLGLEEELLYPAARKVLGELDLIDEAELEHAGLRCLIESLRGMAPGDAQYRARFMVLCEYELHHLKMEEGDLFPLLEKAGLDWHALGLEFERRRAALRGETGFGGRKHPGARLRGGQGGAQRARVALPRH